MLVCAQFTSLLVNNTDPELLLAEGPGIVEPSIVCYKPQIVNYVKTSRRDISLLSLHQSGALRTPLISEQVCV